MRAGAPAVGPGPPTVRALGGLAAISMAAVGFAGCLSLVPPPETPPGRFVERAVTVIVEGTPGLAFEGSYGTPNQSAAARGIVPAQYTLRTSTAVVVSVAKSGADGELTVRILVDDREVQRRSTSSPFGSVILTYRF